MRILIAEDERLIGRAMQAVLARAGHEVVGVASTAARALRLAGRRPAELAFVDVRLADGCGLALASDLQARGVPCVIATGLDLHATEIFGVAVGVIRKPFSPDDLVQTVDIVCDACTDRRPDRVPAAFEFARSPGAGGLAGNSARTGPVPAAASNRPPCGCCHQVREPDLEVVLPPSGGTAPDPGAARRPVPHRR